MWEAYKINRFIDITDMYSLFERHYSKGYHFRGEMHNFWECVYVIDGNVNVTADERVHRLEAGDIIFHKPFEMHKFFIDNEGGVTHFTFSFSAVGEFEKEFSGKVFRLTDKQRAFMEEMIRYYRKMLSENQFETDLLPYNRVLSLFNTDRIFSQKIAEYISSVVLSLAQNGCFRPVLCSGDSEHFARAVDYMKNNLEAQISIAQLAAYINMSESGLKRLFLKYSGLGVHKYFLTLKIKAATEMLASGTAVGEVAYKLGFSSQSYFSACYKRETGRNPSEL